MIPPGLLLAAGACSIDAKVIKGLAHLAVEPPVLSASMFWGFFVAVVRPTLASNTIPARILVPFCHAQGLLAAVKLAVGGPVTVLLAEAISELFVMVAPLSFT
ncbi:hypothetical protein [Paenibacillus allorhizoplanae]|uniref:hypothetical protein n=1 Tax=Paenibacillus allorhizoplanae TaxID=2905648 RepID=UPI001F2AC9C7|nr:hypothetical protein [Paenibacillus allorhizoplanae]